jgi:c-di-GMP-binding flagellar brake protein YcgR
MFASTKPAVPASVITDDDARYDVSSPLEIVSLLRRLQASRALVTVHSGGRFFVTAVLAVEVAEGSVVFDYGIDPDVTRSMLAQNRLVFRSSLDHIQIQFAATEARTIIFDHGTAFRVPIPTTLIRLQRREFYRLRIPHGHPLVCEFAPEKVEGGSRQPLFLSVYDLSCGGLALARYPDGLNPAPGRSFYDTTLRLPDLPVVTADLEVVHVQPGSLGVPPRFGCRFLRTSDRAATLIQRYIHRMERELRAHT